MTWSRAGWPRGCGHHARARGITMLAGSRVCALPRVADRGCFRPRHVLVVAWCYRPLRCCSPHHHTAVTAAAAFLSYQCAATSTLGRCRVVLSLLLQRRLLWHRAMLLLLASLPRTRGLAPCCLAPSPRLNGAMAAHAPLPNYLHARTFSGCIVS